MTKYKCPICGRVNTSMYCDTCEKTIPSQYAVYESVFDRSGADNQKSEAEPNDLRELKEYTKRNNYLLSEIERNTKITAVVMVISAICAVASAIFMLVGIL